MMLGRDGPAVTAVWAAVAMAVVIAVGMSALASGCSSTGPAPLGPGRVIDVVAAENFWGSIASQLGGVHARVRSIVVNPDADPHSYEPTTNDARAVATARMVIANGLGYDTWISKLLVADPGGRTVLTVGKVLGLPAGSNPHRWYNPPDVRTVIATIVADYSKLDPGDTAYFRSRQAGFETDALRTYESLLSEIRTRYAGTPVGASESIFSMLAPALGLDLITPQTFLKTVSEGNDVSAKDKQTIDAQIRAHRIRIYVYNYQNTTPDVQAQLQECRAAGIPTVAISETLAPSSATYEGWQSRQLAAILTALERAAAG